MKKVIYITLTIALFACSKARVYEKDSEGNFTYEEKTNDSIIKRVVLDSSKILSSVEYRNTKKNYLVIYSYKNGKLDQSLKGYINDTALLENCVYYSNGKIAEKFIKTQHNEKVAIYSFRENGSLMKKEFFRTGREFVYSFVTYDSKGKPILTEHKSHFLYISKQDNELVLKPAVLNHFLSAQVFVVPNLKNSEVDLGAMEGYKQNPSQYPSVIKYFNLGSNSSIRINMNELDQTRGLRCKIFINDYICNGIPNYTFYELAIPNLNDIPSTNLYPIIED